jgi:hypothetical protein
MAIYIPTTFFSTLGGFLIANFTGTYGGTGLTGGNPQYYYVEGYFTSGSNQYKYHWFRSAEAFSTSNSGSLTIYSGSTAQAKVIIIGGGGGAGYAINGPGGNSAGGGGGGGIVQYDNFVLTPGTYEIVAGDGGTTGTTGENSYIKLPSNLIVTPFTSSYMIAGGGGGGASTLVAVGSPNVSGKTGGNSGGTAIAKVIESKPTIQSSYNGLGGIKNLTILNQGNAGGGGQYSAGIGYYASGGGGYEGSSNPATSTNIVSNGGDGTLLTLFSPSSMNVIPQYVGGGGNAYGRLSNTLQTTSSYGLGTAAEIGLTNDAPLGGGGIIVGTTSPDSYDGLGGGVYIEYPWRYTPTASLSTNGLLLYNAFNSFSQSIETQTWYDISGNNNHATINGAQMNWNGSGYVFNGVNNYLEYGDLDISTGSYTIITYGQFSTNTTTAGYSKFDGATGFLSSFTLSDTYRTSDQAMQMFNSASTQPNTCYALTNNTNFEQNWYSGILYRNAEFTPISKQVSNGTFVNNNATLKFGYPSTTPSAGYFSGSMNNLLIYNRELFDWEVENAFLYLSQSMQGFIPPPTRSAVDVEYIVVAGGGGNGYLYSGGGGAGGVITGSTSLPHLTTTIITIGNGGSGSNAGYIGTNGQNSSVTGSFISLTAIGGGKGARFNGVSTCVAAFGGGSGGGGNASQNYGNGARGSGTSGQGNSGAAVTYNTYNGGGGGGGAAAEGVGYNGGNGIQWLDGNYYGGGGSGVTISGNYGAGGIGGGGISGSAGTANTGGGAGGKTTGNVSGGSGVAIIRYAGTGSKATGGTITYSGGYTYHTFNSSSTFIV